MVMAPMPCLQQRMGQGLRMQALQLMLWWQLRPLHPREGRGRGQAGLLDAYNQKKHMKVNTSMTLYILVYTGEKLLSQISQSVHTSMLEKVEKICMFIYFDIQ
jgi:hypothetical protein